MAATITAIVPDRVRSAPAPPARLAARAITAGTTSSPPTRGREPVTSTTPRGTSTLIVSPTTSIPPANPKSRPSSGL